MTTLPRTPLRPTPHVPAAAGEPLSVAPTVIDSRQLFQGGNTVQIAHAGQCYQLRLTRENKLILTK